METVLLKDKLDKGRVHLSCKDMLDIMIANSTTRSWFCFSKLKFFSFNMKEIKIFILGTIVDVDYFEFNLQSYRVLLWNLHKKFLCQSCKCCQCRSLISSRRSVIWMRDLVYL